MVVAPCVLGADLTLHVSWAFSLQDFALVQNLAFIASELPPAAALCVTDLLLTVDPLQKTSESLKYSVSSPLGVALYRELEKAAEKTVTTLGKLKRASGFAVSSSEDQNLQVKSRIIPLDYSDHSFLEATMSRVLGIPHWYFADALRHVAKHTLAHAAALSHCHTDYLLHFDSDIAIIHYTTPPANSWFTTAADALMNASFLPGLFAVTLEECDQSAYPPGTFDLTIPLRPDVGRHYTAHANTCVAVTGEDLVQTVVARGDDDLVVCQAICSQNYVCSAVEWYAKGWDGHRCFHINTPEKASGGYNGDLWRDAVCFVKHDDLERLPSSARGNLYLRYHKHGGRGGPHFSMQHYLMHTPRFDKILPLLSNIANTYAAADAELWRQNIETLIELRLRWPARGEDGRPHAWPSFAAFLQADAAGGACRCEIGGSCPLVPKLHWYLSHQNHSIRGNKKNKKIRGCLT